MNLAILSHPDKLLWPEVGVTKAALLDHYRRAWRRMRPFVADRPLTLVRAPNGVTADGASRFFQQHATKGMPAAIRRMPDPRDGSELLFVSDFDGIAALVQFGTVEIHVWNATVHELERPDQVVFDFDPDEGLGAEPVRRAALDLRACLKARGRTSFVKASGGKGFHVAVPLAGASWDEAAAFASGLAREMAGDAPGRFTTEAAKTERRGRIFIDVGRNNRGATTVAPWSSRARARGTVAVPIPWSALESGAGPTDCTLGGERLADALAAPNPWTGFFRRAVPLGT